MYFRHGFRSWSGLCPIGGCAVTTLNHQVLLPEDSLNTSIVYTGGLRYLKVAKLVLLMQKGQYGQYAQPFIISVLTGKLIISRFLPFSFLQTLLNAHCSFLMCSSSGTSISIPHSLGINGHQLKHTCSMPLAFSYSITRAQQCCQPYAQNISVLQIFFKSPLYYAIIILLLHNSVCFWSYIPSYFKAVTPSNVSLA
jgi:hypothetical protein